jgi:cytochrome P450
MNNNDATLIANPYPNYQRWRDEQPIWWSDGELKGWILSRYDDVRTILKDSKTFSSQSMGEGETQAMRLPLLTDDPPRHTQLRAVVNKAFTSRTLKKMEVEVAELTAELLDEMRGKTSVDISAEFTSPLPVSVIARNARMTSNAGLTPSQAPVRQPTWPSACRTSWRWPAISNR